MDRLKRGFLFLMQAGRIAHDSPQVLLPLAYYLGAGLATAAIVSILAALALARLGVAGAGLAGFLLVLLVLALLVAGYLASVEVCQRVYGQLAPAQVEETRPAWAALRHHGLDLAGMAVATPLIAPLRLALGRQPAGAFLTAPWTQAVGLVSTSMAVEGLDLKKGLERAGQMVCDNLLIMQPGQVAAGWAGILVGLPVWIGGILLGWGAGRGIALSPWGLPHRSAVGMVVGLLVASLFLLIAVAAGAYFSAAYCTCLYAWARDVETSRRSGSATMREPPLPLARVLAGLESLTAPVYSESNPTTEG